MKITIACAAALVLAACSDAGSPGVTGPAEARTGKPPGGGSGIILTTLPSLGGTQSRANAINDASEIVGSSRNLAGQLFAVRWTPQGNGAWAVVKLSAAGGEARAINQDGDAVGVVGARIKLWPRSGTEEDVGAGDAADINGSDLVVGIRRDITPARGGAWIRSGSTWTPYTLAPLPEVDLGLAHYEEPRSVNEADIIVGFAHDNNGVQYAVHWDPTGTPGVWGPATPFPVASAYGEATAESINGADVVGRAFCADQSCGIAYHWSLGGTGIGVLGTTSGFATASNDALQIAGVSFQRIKGRTTSRAFTWSPAVPALTDLGIVGRYTDTWATGLNNRTLTRTAVQVVGYGEGSPGRIAIVWTIP